MYDTHYHQCHDHHNVYWLRHLIELLPDLRNPDTITYINDYFAFRDIPIINIYLRCS